MSGLDQDARHNEEQGRFLYSSEGNLTAKIKSSDKLYREN